MKKWYESKTMWVNAAVGVLGIAVGILQSAPIAPETLGMILAGIASVNGFLRTITSEGVG